MAQHGMSKVLAECLLDAVWQKGAAQEHPGVLLCPQIGHWLCRLAWLSRHTVAVGSRVSLGPSTQVMVQRKQCVATIAT